MKSLRTHLVFWLTGALGLGIVVVLAATYGFAHRQFSEILDEELRLIAQAVHLREDWREAGDVRIAREDVAFAVRAYDEGGKLYFESGLPALPVDAPQTLDPGFSTIATQIGLWRVYTHVMPEGVVQVGQPETTREELARDLALELLLPLLLLIPVFALLVAWVLKRGLSPLEETTRSVSDRDASRLDPLATTDVPQELLPLVEQINALLRRLAGALEVQRRFVADAAHELRSPVAALALQAQLAARAQSKEARVAAYAELERGIDRTERLVEQLLDLAHIEPGVPAEAREPLDVARLAREVVGSFAARADALGVDLGADAPGPAHLTGGRAELHSLLANLVDNALRYAPHGSQVTVAARNSGSRVELEVTDAGPGIPAEERARVLERFQRVEGDPAAGSGLGLAIARAIVERHGGEIVLADARPGSSPPGLSVRITLPA
ncbi:MAG TPA: ATP-binding protein [Burkholderiales bacterium]|nr:ATP-binding protein [Burkholderiales bacterium]